jgi:hypothetical protein
MAKRSLSPDLIPGYKRHQTYPPSLQSSHNSRFPLRFGSLFDELILLIFTYLSWEDLCTVQSVSHSFQRLASDNGLWRSLYILNFGRTRLQGSRGYATRADGREVKPLPGRALLKHESGAQDWKWMFRISSNWKKGVCGSTGIAAFCDVEFISKMQVAVR